ncbi:MAG: hypothetical protein JO021_14805 [Alphaproteobacteria bacterium]|nr:hypothetical protein [Alphaproteobacteria bacterium]
MPSRRLTILGAVALVGISTAIACGPFFPTQLIDGRAETLRAAPVNSFAFEATRLVTPSDDLKAHEVKEYWDARPDRDVKNRDAAEVEGLSPTQTQAVAQMRQATSGDAAERAGAILPAGVRIYTAGAVDFREGELDGATRRFEAILKLPRAEQAARATWAAYMLGRTRALDDDVAGAAQAFQLTRTLARAGAPDPLGLAVASFGEEARLHLPAPDAPKPGAEHAGAIAQAVALYAEQAARDSDSGVQSLRMVAERLMREPQRLPAVVKEPMVQRLLVAYVLARVQDPMMALSEFNDFQVGDIDRTNRAKPPDQLAQLVDAIEQAGVDAPAGADRLAALAYYTGRYPLAERLVTRADGPLAAWVGAKLALQRGDLAAAAERYAVAARAFPTTDRAVPIDTDNRRLLVGERGILALARGEYRSALEHLYQARYWGDVAYIAERVLTADELKRFVDETPPLPDDKASDPDAWVSDEAPSNITRRLRDLLARRLMREQRFDEARGYFAVEEVRNAAQLYAQARRDATTLWRGVDRAAAWWTAASMARFSGLEILGYETGPDYAVRAANYDTGLGLTALDDDPYIGADERARFAQTTPVPDKRFHYRYIAVDEALRAAEALPPRSEAFAAVLCHAAAWMFSSRNDDAALALYRLYVAKGPIVPWAKTFGRDCPQPDFDAAAQRVWSQPIAQARRAVRRNRLWLALAAAMVGGGLAWYLWRNRPGRTA